MKISILLIVAIVLSCCSSGVYASEVKVIDGSESALLDSNTTKVNSKQHKVDADIVPANSAGGKSEITGVKAGEGDFHDKLDDIEKILKTQSVIMTKLDSLTENMYLSNENFGKKNGAGDYYRFVNSPEVKQTENGFFFKKNFLVDKKNKSNASGDKSVYIKTNDYVTFSLDEMLPDGTTISETPTITVLNNDKLPDVVRAAFSVGQKGEVVTIATLAKSIYSNLNNYPRGVTPETTLFYKVKIINVRGNDSQDLSLLRNYKDK